MPQRTVYAQLSFWVEQIAEAILCKDVKFASNNTIQGFNYILLRQYVAISKDHAIQMRVTVHASPFVNKYKLERVL